MTQDILKNNIFANAAALFVATAVVYLIILVPFNFHNLFLIATIFTAKDWDDFCKMMWTLFLRPTDGVFPVFGMAAEWLFTTSRYWLLGYFLLSSGVLCYSRNSKINVPVLYAAGIFLGVACVMAPAGTEASRPEASKNDFIYMWTGGSMGLLGAALHLKYLRKLFPVQAKRLAGDKEEVSNV